jgi:hypothetical protein
LRRNLGRGLYWSDQPAILLNRASALPAKARVSPAAGMSRPSRTACPAQRLVKSSLPCFSAAAFNGPRPVAAFAGLLSREHRAGQRAQRPTFRRRDHEVGVHRTSHRSLYNRKFDFEKIHQSAVGPHGLLSCGGKEIAAGIVAAAFSPD